MNQKAVRLGKISEIHPHTRGHTMPTPQYEIWTSRSGSKASVILLYFFIWCIRNETVAYVCFCVCVSMHISGTESVCGLQWDCRGSIDSLNPIFIPAGGDTDENWNGLRQYLCCSLQDIKRDGGCLNAWCFPTCRALNLGALCLRALNTTILTRRCAGL